MKVTLESKDDVKAINWLHVKDRIMTEVAEKIADLLREASSQFGDLKDGEVRHFDITVGTITISKDA